MLIDLVCLSPAFLKLGLFYCLSEPSSPSPVKPVKRYKLLFITIILDLQDEDLDVLKCLGYGCILGTLKCKCSFDAVNFSF